MQRSHSTGFSLIEMMVVVAIIGILSAIALPSYNDHMRKTRRAAGAACALAVAQQAERCYTTNMTYVGFQSVTPDPANICEPKAREFYTVSRGTPTAKEYTISATPKGAQSGDSCGVLTVDQTGQKCSNGTTCPASPKCW